ncbi:MAG: AarF/ABC1/UbiB kinase family protein [bacterium]|nr:AarF/ABC1/UbiB kinase family protein [bacterium]MCP5066466.1 AarF/ABC1/UbiB kinase family protein [bacterium]
MARSGTPSVFALSTRFLVLLGLIGRAAWIWLTIVLDGKGVFRAAPGALVDRQVGFARHFVATANRFKGGLIKLGQVASLRVDVLPEEVSDELARLQDRVEPHASQEIRGQIEAELGRPLEEVYRRFEDEPLAAASLGQVHEAELPGGERVAVKVLYPGVERSVTIDLLAARIALWLFDWVTIADLGQVHGELAESIHGEMDYEREGRAAEEVAGNLGRDPEVAAHVRIPAIHWQATSRRVLTMEFLSGCKVNDSLGVEARGRDAESLVVWATRAFLHMMFRDGFFHCDPHPGNLLVCDDGRLGIIDFGMNKRIAPAVMAMLRESLLSSMSRDARRYTDALLAAGMIDPRDRDAVEALVRISFAPEYWNLTPKEASEIDFSVYLRRMRSQLKNIRSFRLPDGLVMWSRALTLLLGLATELAPGIRPLDVVGPYVTIFLAGDLPGSSS